MTRATQDGNRHAGDVGPAAHVSGIAFAKLPTGLEGPLEVVYRCPEFLLGNGVDPSCVSDFRNGNDEIRVDREWRGNGCLRSRSWARRGHVGDDGDIKWE